MIGTSPIRLEAIFFEKHLYAKVRCGAKATHSDRFASQVRNALDLRRRYNIEGDEIDDRSRCHEIATLKASVDYGLAVGGQITNSPASIACAIVDEAEM